MKDTIAAIIAEYGLDEINYGLIVFGDTASIRIQFGEYSKVDDLLRVLSFIPKKRRGASLDEALKEAESLFTSSDVRPHAKKVLVVITDLVSGETSSQVSEAAKPLQDKDIKIIAVAIGKEADPKELEIITPMDKIIKEDKNVQPDDLKKEIMAKVLTGWFSEFIINTFIVINEFPRISFFVIVSDVSGPLRKQNLT